MRIVFMGTPDFAVPCLEALFDSDDEVVGVFCQPDKPFGRKHELKMPETKVCALKHNAPVFQPATLKNGEGVKILEELRPDLVIVVAYGKILPADFLNFPKYGCINIHASLLPKYRGASPIQFAVLNGDKMTGVTAMQMDEGLDTGDILIQNELEITENDSADSMFSKLSSLGVKTMLDAISGLRQGKLSPKKQDESLATKVGLITKEMGEIDFKKSAKEVHNLIRGLYSWPCAFAYLNSKKLKIFESRLTGVSSKLPAGSIVKKNGEMFVCCGEGEKTELLKINSVQLEGKKRQDAKTFLNGAGITDSTVLKGHEE